jgi:uncharacterized protein (TIGR02246 family)
VQFACHTAVNPKRSIRAFPARGIQKSQEENLKIGLLLAAAGVAVSFISMTFAQQKEKVDLPTSQQRDLLGIPNALETFGELSGKLDDAYNNKDAEAVAALFTEDAVLVTPDGMVLGRQAIEKSYADTFQRLPITGFLSRQEPLQLAAIDNAVWSVGEWLGTLQSETGPIIASGYWSSIYVREGDAWKMRMLSLFDHRPLSPRNQ